MESGTDYSLVWRGIVESSNGIIVEYSLKQLCSQLPKDKQAWTTVDKELIDQFEVTEDIVGPSLSVLGLIALESLRYDVTFVPGKTLFDALSRSSGATEQIIGRLSKIDLSVKLAFVSLQFINSTLAGFVIPQYRNDAVYTMLHAAGLWRALGKLMEQKQVCEACRGQLSDLQSLLYASLSKLSQVPILLDSVASHKYTYRNLEQKIGELSEHLDGSFDLSIESSLRDLISTSDGNTGLLGLLDINELLVSYRKWVHQQEETSTDHKLPLFRGILTILRLLPKHLKIENSVLADDLKDGSSRSLAPPTYIPSKSSPKKKESKERDLLPLPPLPHQTYNQLFFQRFQLQAASLNSFMRLWTESQALTGDFENLAIAFETLLRHVLDPGSVKPDRLLFQMSRMSYEEVRDLQVADFETRVQHRWTRELDSMSSRFVVEYRGLLKEVLLRLLLKGDYFLIHDPTSTSVPLNSPQSLSNLKKSQKAVAPDRYFVVLSPTRKFIQYRLADANETTSIARSNLKYPHVIELSSITSVTVHEISGVSQLNYPRKIHFNSRISYRRIEIEQKRNLETVSLTLYSETAEKATMWSDGIRLASNSQYQSDYVKENAQKLAAIKLKLQLMSLAADDYEFEIQEEEELATTEVISNNYYYS